MSVSPDLISMVTSEADRIEAAMAERHLSNFIRMAWPIVEPGTHYLDNWHIGAMCEYLEAVTSGQITRLLINIPPRYMKSRAVSVFWPVWEWTTKPFLRYLFASYSVDLSTAHSLDRRTILQSDWYLKHWGHKVRLTGDQNVKTEYRNTEQGVMVATSITGTAIGKGGNRVVIDDPHNTQQAESELERRTAVLQFDRAFSTRLNDKKRDAIVVVMQRLHEGDVSARCLEQGYTHLCLPAEAEAKTTIVLPRSGKTIEREPGELLWPEREGEVEIARAKVSLGPYGYAGQYQQRPSPAEGGLVKRHWWRYWHPADQDAPPVVVDGREIASIPLPPLPELAVFDTWDATFKDTRDSDWVVGGTLGRKGADAFLLDRVRGRMAFPATLSAIRQQRMKWPTSRASLIEDAANGPALIATLQHEIPGVLAVECKGQSKEARLQAVLPMIAAGNVYLPHPAFCPWTLEFIEWLAQFPMGAYDDDVDMISHALRHIQPDVWAVTDKAHREAKATEGQPKTLHELRSRAFKAHLDKIRNGRNGGSEMTYPGIG